MSDFASSAMIRLIRLGLARLGVDEGNMNAGSQALIPLGEKRRVLADLWQKLGPGEIVRLGEGVHHATDEPVLMALAMATDFHDLMQRMARLGRFVHSRHRMQLQSLADNRVRIRHISLIKDDPPSVAEDLLVWGLLVSLAERIGVKGLRTRFDSDKEWRREEGGEWIDLPWPKETSSWIFSWCADTKVRSSSAPISVQSAADETTRLRKLILRDPSRQWTVERAAAEMGITGRTLQRRLKNLHTGFAKQLAQVRVAAAGHMLINTDNTPNEIGYSCGFSDQAHFIRTFKRHTAMTPLVYRKQFLAGKEVSFKCK